LSYLHETALAWDYPSLQKAQEMPLEEPPLPAPAVAPSVAGLNMCIHQFPEKPAAFFGNISN